MSLDSPPRDADQESSGDDADPSSGMGDRRDGHDESTETRPTVLLCMRAGRDRDLLSAALQDRYHVRTGIEKAALERSFDCCLFDRGTFTRLGNAVADRRARADPVFLPFVLLVQGDTASTPPEIWETVDDVIHLPVPKRALGTRIGNLVQRRQTAMKLTAREAELEETVATLELKEQAMDEAPIGISITDPTREDNPIQYINQQFGAITGYYEEAIGRNCRLLQGDETDPETVAAMREAINSERPVSVDIANYRKNDQLFWNKVDIAPISAADGTVTNFVGFQTEITDRKIRERRLAVLNRVLAHNMRNTMTVISGHISLLREVYAGDDKRDGGAGEISDGNSLYDGSLTPSFDALEESLEDLTGLADRVREIDRVLSQPAPKEPVDLENRIETMFGAFRDRFPSTTFRLERADPSSPVTSGVAVAIAGLMAAIEEAVENAAKHNDGPEPMVTVRLTTPSSEWVEIAVEDNGPPIPEREIAVLRAGETPLNHADRLGIWLIYWVVSKAGGQLSITERAGGGNRLTLTVPVATHENTSSAETENSRS